MFHIFLADAYDTISVFLNFERSDRNMLIFRFRPFTIESDGAEPSIEVFVKENTINFLEIPNKLGILFDRKF